MEISNNKRIVNSDSNHKYFNISESNTCALLNDTTVMARDKNGIITYDMDICDINDDNITTNNTCCIGSLMDVDAANGISNDTTNVLLDDAEINASLDNILYSNGRNINDIYNDKIITIDNAAEYQRYVESLVASLDVVVGCNGTSDGSMAVGIDINVRNDDDEHNTYMELLLDHQLRSFKD